MTLRERALYHQIHPLKLATDWGTAAGAASLVWQHRLGPALALGIIPSVIVSVVLITWIDLERYRHSPFGRFMRRHMTRRVEAARLLGVVPFWGGAWIHRPLVIAAGVAWILGCWVWGLRRASSRDDV